MGNVSTAHYLPAQPTRGPQLTGWKSLTYTKAGVKKGFCGGKNQKEHSPTDLKDFSWSTRFSWLEREMNLVKGSFGVFTKYDLCDS